MFPSILVEEFGSGVAADGSVEVNGVFVYRVGSICV